MSRVSHMRHRHHIDHHVRIDDRDRERVDAQAGYSVHATTDDVVTPIATRANHAQAVDEAKRERRSAQNARVVERVEVAGDVEDRNGSSCHRNGHGSPRSNAVNRRDGDELVHAQARLFWLLRREAIPRAGSASRRASRRGSEGIVPLRGRAVLPLLDNACGKGNPPVVAVSADRAFQVVLTGESTILDSDGAWARSLPIRR